MKQAISYESMKHDEGLIGIVLGSYVKNISEGNNRQVVVEDLNSRTDIGYRINLPHIDNFISDYLSNYKNKQDNLDFRDRVMLDLYNNYYAGENKRSVRQIANDLEVSTSTIYRRLKKLREKGVIVYKRSERS